MKTRIGVVAVCTVAFLLASAVSVFADDPVSANREALVKCLIKLAARAQEYYHKPVSEGGGGGSFATLYLAQLTSWPNNEDGSFVLVSAAATSIVLSGTGIETGFNGTNPAQAYLTVYADSVTLVLTN